MGGGLMGIVFGVIIIAAGIGLAHVMGWVGR